MLANYHTHTARCNHAAGEDREYVEAAIAAGYRVLGFADHAPFVFPGDYVSPTRMTAAETEGYFSSLTALKKEYATDITIYIGFESEYLPELLPAQDALLADYPLDYMILGQHFITPEPYGHYTGFEGDLEGLVQYTDSIIAGMETGRYIYTAHPDLYRYRGDGTEEQFRRIARYMKEKNIPVEINLLGLVTSRHYPSDTFLTIAAEEGCSAIIGVDAHEPLAFSDSAAVLTAARIAESYGLPLVDFMPGLGPL